MRRRTPNTAPIWLGVLSVAVAAGLSACQGTIGGGSDDDGDEETSTQPICSAEEQSPGPSPIRRLTLTEYTRTIGDIFAVDVSPLAASLPAESETDGFSNDAVALTVNVDHATAYMDIASAVAQQVISDPEKRGAILQSCDPIAAACLDPIVRQLGRRVFRRPLAEPEVADLLALTAKANPATPYDALALLIEGLLQAPQFLFRPELGRADDSDRPGLVRLTGYELATRLSFLLWQQAPHPAVLDAAENGELDTPSGLLAWADRMLDDPRAKDAMRVFADEWLDLSLLDGVSFEHPAFSESLRAAAKTELALLIDEYFWTDKSLLGLYNGSGTFLNEELALHYGVSGISGSAHVPYVFAPDSPRAGLFGTAGFAMIAGASGTNTIVHRGKIVRKVLLCDAPPPPPPDVEAELAAPGEDPLSVVAARAENPVCGSCHRKMDGIGLGLEQFDLIGAARDHYETEGNVYPLPASGYIDLDGNEPTDFVGARQLGELVAESEMAPHCAVQKTFRWAFGRSLTPADTCTIDTVAQRWKSADYRFRELLRELVQSDAFRYRLPANP